MLLSKIKKMNRNFIKDKHSVEEYARFQTVYKVIKNLLRLLNVNIESNKLKAGQGPGLYLSNHKSNVDGLVLYYTLFKSGMMPTFVAKKELESNKYIAAGLNLINAIVIDRDNIRDKFNSIDKISELLKSGKSVIVFAEGTRISNPYEFQQYHSGSIVSCTRAFKNIYPVVIANAHL
jgi:1-acyl-sn-glycerol-3-phosphate acyltransferase